MTDVPLNDQFTFKGIGLSTYGVGGYADSSVGNYITNAVSSGANSVVIGNVGYVDLSTNKIGDAFSGSYDQTARLVDVDAATKQAEQQGLHVLLKPQLVTNDPSFSQYTSGSWINLVNPDLKITNPDAFFASYKSYILEWAKIAETDHVQALSLGNEMVAATKPEYTHYWDDIISAVRSVYHGQLTYSALLPTLTSSSSNEVTQIQFWDKLDFAGFDVYPSLATKNDPSVAELNAAWHHNTVYGQDQDYYSFIEQMAQHVGKPVVFTETGLPSFQGAANREASSDGNIGSPTSLNNVAATDFGEQANWWQSFFETWMQNKPEWLKGAFVWNNDPEDLGSSYANSYNIIGKPAEGVVASWYGGRTELAAMSTTLKGSQADDQLYAYGHAAGTSGTGTAAGATLSTTVSVSLTASVIAGHSPSFRILVNGEDRGSFDIKPTDSGYVTDAGVHFVTNQTYSVSLAGLQSIDSIKVEWVGDKQGNDTIFFNGVSVDGVALNGLTYTTAHGYVQQQQFGNGTSSQWDAGSTSVDTTAWNTALHASTIGSAANPIVVTGNGGDDTLNVLGSLADYRIVKTGADSFTLSEDRSLGQNIVASDVSSVSFKDGGQFAMTADGHLAVSGTVATVVTGSAGADYISAETSTGAGILSGGQGGDTIVGGPGNNHVYGNSPTAIAGSLDGADSITVGTGSNYVNGNAGDDVIVAGATGSTGSNRLLGGSGNDQITIHGAGINLVNGNRGNDVIDASDATGHVVLRGGQDDDVIRGGHGTNEISGDLGNDTLQAGTGVNHLDVLTGGQGADTFDFSHGAASVATIDGARYYQQVTDLDTASDHLRLPFTPQAGDILVGGDAFGSVAAAQGSAQAALDGHAGGHDVYAAAVGGSTYLFYTSSGNGGAIDSIIQLAGVQPSSLHADLFG